MDIQMLNKVFSSPFHLKEIIANEQRRKNTHRFDFLKDSRSRCALFYIAEYPVRYELPSGEFFVAEVGDVMLLPRGSHYAVTFLTPENAVSHPILLSFFLTDESDNDIPLGQDIIKLTHDDGALFPVFFAATQFYKNGELSMAKAKSYEILGRIFPLREHDECGISYIHQNYTKRLSIPDLAKRCAVSETVYRKQFRKLTGHSPIQYITRLKIEKARELLGENDMDLKDISEFLNFYNLPYFHRVFKEVTRLTPGQYREIHKKAP